MKDFEEKVVESPNLSLVSKDHVNKWVALSTDYRKLLAVGATLSAVLEQAPQKEKVVMKVLPNLGYAPTALQK